MWRSRTYFSREEAPLFLPGTPSPSTPLARDTRGLGPCGQTYQRFLAHGEHGRVGLQVHPAAPPHGLQPLHRDVLGIPQAQPHQVQHAREARPSRPCLRKEAESRSAGTPHAGTRPQARGQPGNQLLVSRLPLPVSLLPVPRFPAPLARFPAARGAVGAQGPPGVVVPGLSGVMAAAGRPGPGGVPAVLLASGHSIPVLGLGKWGRARPEPSSLPEALSEGGGHPAARPGRLSRFGAALGPQPDSPEGSPDRSLCSSEGPCVAGWSFVLLPNATSWACWGALLLCCQHSAPLPAHPGPVPCFGGLGVISYKAWGLGADFSLEHTLVGLTLLHLLNWDPV